MSQVSKKRQIALVIKKRNLRDPNLLKEDLEYWRSRPPEERIATVEGLRREYYGDILDLAQVVDIFNSYKIEYLIVGSYALAFHGAPRNTGDIDVWIKPDKINAERILKSLDAFGFGSLDLSADDFTHPDKIIQLGDSPIKIDLITSISGVSWDEAVKHGVKGPYGHVTVNFIGLNEFIKNKKATGRLQDLADLERLAAE